MLKTVEFPARIARLDAALAEVDGDDFTHLEVVGVGRLE
ncbi:hypothetical protein PC121_g21876 [Phytophthora cactorum]|uniref:Uncharacterized protein n=1 Tax=Phytophthora cactorum TaxID=29920 RepID=A0A8T1B262_9STRA|nr:hypothetical protein PC117_g24169 [Phytophthora cactorum]KAG3044479.1 hypothetical protein PC121_g21876 [Phytophthora cactorum]KAG4040100.1 hypothetical protein PC123_g24353 [Phytophthora cactorum]